jgi:hypothetical protein
MTNRNLQLTILHHIFLSSQERYKIGNFPNIEVKAIGMSMPVWYSVSDRDVGLNINTDEPAEEIFCRYALSNLKSDRIIDALNDGYRIFLPHSVTKRLLDLKDGGAEEVAFRHRNEMEIEGSLYRVAHYVVVRDSGNLTKTLAY